MKYHPYYRGKIEISPKVPIRSFEDFAVWYSPGVADACLSIKSRREAVFELTNRWNTVAIVTDGTRVLGLGNIGPEAGLPVMEGKSLLFKYLGGVDAFPLCLSQTSAEALIETIQRIEPSFGGINLEDIEQPKCFRILNSLRKSMNIPVWHDDQQGTATVVLAGVLNALKLVGKRIQEMQVCMVGAGAANIAIERLIVAAGARPGNITMVDSRGILNSSRKDLEKKFPEKWKVCITTNSEGKTGGLDSALRGTDTCIAMSKPGPGVISKKMIKSMNDSPIVFACANPVPEIWPWDAKKAGAKIVATGRSDFPNQINNSLGFPGIFRGTLDVRASTITDEMCIVASQELANLAEEKGLSEDSIVPSMDDWEVFPREATAVGLKAQEQSVARRKIGRRELLETATKIIMRARKLGTKLMKTGLISPIPE